MTQKTNQIKHYPDKVGFQNLDVEKFPSMIVLISSNACNSNCVHCAFRRSNLRKREGNLYMSSELFSKVFDECIGEKTWIRITGTGEPFMNPHLVAALIKGKSKGLSFGVITNGSLVTPEKAKKLIDVGIDMFEFSVDAGTKEEYEKIRVGLKFETLLENVDFALNYRNKTKAQTKIIVSIINQPDRVDIKKAENFWKKKGVDNVMIRKWLTYGVLEKERYSMDVYLKPENRISCPYPWERMWILSNGNVTFCNYDVKEEDGYYLGNINNQSIKEVWRSPKFDAWRKILVKKEFGKIPLCAKCEDWKYRSWDYNYWKVQKDANKKRREVIGDE
ncbi:MAG: radical SAM protein [Patescibacteria group bacterium]